MQAGCCRYPLTTLTFKSCLGCHQGGPCPCPHLSAGEEEASPTRKPQPPSLGPAATEGSVGAVLGNCHCVPRGQAAPAPGFTDEHTEALNG